MVVGDPSEPAVILPPAGLMDRQRRSRAIQIAAKCDWYVVRTGSFDFVGKGDVSEADLRAVHRELRDQGVFVCVPKPTSLDEQLGAGRMGMKLTPRRIRRSEEFGARLRPKLRWVALGARVAVLPADGPVWVDDEHLFKPGEVVPLPWTEPLVQMTVVRPKSVLEAMHSVLGPSGPKRATLPPPPS
jgi:hypothetical protein